jgi:dTDP-4-dehydrorhamnose 3,5-epimerase-like enzyme
MNESTPDLWRGLSDEARSVLETRDYRSGELADAVADTGVEARQLVTGDRTESHRQRFWIPGVEVFQRSIFPQRHRGSFGEFGRRGEGVLGSIGMWPRQWAAARMFAQTAKGFHVHPPSVPGDVAPAEWFRRLFVERAEDYSLRRYDDEQWDVMFIVQGVAEMILRDVRAGLPTRTMRFTIDGDNHRGPNNVGVVIPAGVAHALRAEGSEDVIMVYGTTTTFRPEFEGRIASDVEAAPLPASWERFLKAQ